MYADTTYSIYRNFEQWMIQLNDPVNNVGDVPAAVKEDGLIEQLGRDDSTLKSWKIVGCWPTSMGQIAMDWATNNAPLEFTVTLSNDYIIGL